MNQELAFFQYIHHKPLADLRLERLSERELLAGDDIRIQVSRYLWASDDPMEAAAFVYHLNQDTQQLALELKYCIPGKRYCALANCKATLCAYAHQEDECLQSQSTVEIITIAFSSTFFCSRELDWLAEWPVSASHHAVVWKPVQVNNRIISLLNHLLHHPYQGLDERLYVQSKALELLVVSREQMHQKPVHKKTRSRFLTHPEDREKIYQARDIMLQHLDEPLTIRELSRKVAMNECYLKKGFKEIFGTTIYDYFQRERMEKARQLLYEQGMSVSAVAAQMGYSSISHFSTAFKKYTGLKPCELIR
ncbi:MAG: AraC family transcriptional regulator [Thermoflavifilum sp.]|nr:AraC family transcriptional regulator [Thermoflavifilum sp.]